VWQEAKKGDDIYVNEKKEQIQTKSEPKATPVRTPTSVTTGEPNAKADQADVKALLKQVDELLASASASVKKGSFRAAVGYYQQVLKIAPNEVNSLHHCGKYKTKEFTDINTMLR
jgi:hypothetical protein